MSRLHQLLAPIFLVSLAACAAEPVPPPTTEGLPMVETMAFAQFLQERGPYLRCDDRVPTERPGETRSLGGFRDASHEVLAVRLDAPCTYQLRIAGGDRETNVFVDDEIPVPAATYVSASGARVGADLVVVLNALDAEFVDRDAEGQLETRRPRNYRIVSLIRDGETGEWSAPVTVAEHARSAVWLVAMAAREDRLVVRYGLDSLHEKLFFAHEGRAAEDGFYLVDLHLDGGTLHAGAATRLSDYVADPIAEMN